MAESRALRFDPIAEAQRQWQEHGWEDAAEGMAVVTSIIRVEQVILQRIDALLKPMGLTFARYELLVLLHFSRSGALPLGKLGERLQVHPASITNVVNRLEADELVERADHPEDGRTTLATLTPAGRKLALQATKVLNADIFTELGWSATDLRTMFRLLRKFRLAAGDFT